MAMSAAYLAVPVTFSRASLRRGDFPTTVKADTGFTGTFARWRSIRFPSTSCA